MFPLSVGFIIFPMCKTCSTGFVPGCCYALCGIYSQTWMCSTWKSEKFWIKGLYLNSCPYGFGNAGLLVSNDLILHFLETMEFVLQELVLQVINFLTHKKL